MATPQPRQPKPAPPRAGLSLEEKRRIEEHLTVTEPRPAIGLGATQVPKVFKGCRAVAARGLPTQLLRNCDLRSLFMAEGVEFFCCMKTFGRAVASAAEHTPMLEPVGKRWRLLGGDQLLEKLNASEDEPKARAAPAGPAPPVMDPPPMAKPPASSTTPTKPSAGSTTPTEPPASSIAHPEPLASQMPTSPEHAPAQPPIIEGQPTPAADIAGPLVSPERELEELVIQEWLLARENRGYQRIRPGDIMRVSLASVHDSVSASRHPGKKPRDGP